MSILFLLAALGVGADPSASVRIQTTKDTTRPEIVATLSDQLLAQIPIGKLTQEQGEPWLRLSLVSADKDRDSPAILGSYQRREKTLVFAPRYPLAHDLLYRATLVIARGQTTTADYQVPPRPPTPPTVVEQIYPSAWVLPANHLKFYLHFSQPMREDANIFDRIHLLDANGKHVEGAWRHTELWSADRKRFTLWIHPGRVKLGVNLREQLGPVLQSNREYTLVIGADVVDDEGRALGKEFTKKFRATAEERTRPRIEDWKLQAPPAQTTRPLVLKFPKALDRALLDRLITVVDAQGNLVRGRIDVAAEERSWSFHPEQAWQQDEYAVRVDGQLEDLAGNTFLRLFDVDLEKPAPQSPKLKLTFLPQAKAITNRYYRCYSSPRYYADRSQYDLGFPIQSGLQSPKLLMIANRIEIRIVPEPIPVREAAIDRLP